MMYYSEGTDITWGTVHRLSLLNDRHLFKVQWGGTLRDEVIKWLETNIGDENWYIQPNYVVNFRNHDDAMLFKLAWSDE